MAYTNEMRHAVRALKNPTPLHVDVAEKDGNLKLLIDQPMYNKLSKGQKADFNAYLKQMIAVIELGGGGRVDVLHIGPGGKVL